MHFFLEQLADYHLQKYLTDISDFCFVFPNRRAGVFFRRYLNEKTPQPIFAPDILTINDFFGKLDPRPVSDNISLVFKLYNSYKATIRKDLSLDEFIPWGEMCLSDFDDIDKYLADPDQVFRNLADQKALEDDFSHLEEDQIKAIRTFWNTFDPQKLSRLQQSFLEVWERMPDLYHHFNEQLDQNNEVYEGKLFRSVARGVKERTLGEIPYKHVVFAGLNALNNCEKRLLHHLQARGVASFFWDYPGWTLGGQTPRGPERAPGSEHEAARFIRRNLADFPMPDDWEDLQSEGPQEINIATAANDLGQTQIAAQTLKEIAATEKSASSNNDTTPHPAGTALILADESLMLPAIHAIPGEWDKINVTLGYPIKKTPAYGLIESLMTLQRSIRTTRKGKTWLYHRHLIAVLRHQYITAILGNTGRELVRKITSANRIFIEKSEIPHHDLIKLLLQKAETTADLTEYLKELLHSVYQHLLKNPETTMEREFVYHLYLTVKRLGEILAQQEETINTDTWHRLFRKLAEFRTVPFRGEPLSGLQVMGILETRVLDFENLVVMGMNEGTFPHTAPPNSFIPYNLRKGFGLPTIDHQDSIFAYYFYRLIHRAKKVTLVWSSSDAGQQAAEMSRFLHQLYYEYSGTVRSNTYIQPAGTKTAPAIHAEKNAGVMQQLADWLENGNKKLSPSALSHYIECPLRFYYSYLAGAKEPEIITEELDPRIFGNLFHETVEALYLPFLGRDISQTEIEKIAEKNNLHNTLLKIFEKNIPFIRQNENIFVDMQGKNSLVFEVLMNYLSGFFNNEKAIAPFTIKGLETKVESIFETQAGRKVRLGGAIDRLDIKDGILRVIDYKTGKGNNRIKEIDDLFDATQHDDIKAVFQTLLYSLMIGEKEFPPENIQPGVVWMRSLFTNADTSLYLQPPRGKKETLTLSLAGEEFSQALGHLLDELFDEKIPFRQTDHLKNCEHCIYREICLR